MANDIGIKSLFKIYFLVNNIFFMHVIGDYETFKVVYQLKLLVSKNIKYRIIYIL